MVFFGMPVGLGLGRDHEPHYGRREGMVLMPYDPLWVGQLAGLHTLEGQDCGTGGRPTGYSLYERQYSFRRQPEVTQRGKGVTTQTCFLPRGRRAQARSVGEGASPCQANLGVSLNKQTNKLTCLLNHGRLPLRVVTLPMLYALGPSAALAELK